MRRRDFIGLAGASLAYGALAACGSKQRGATTSTPGQPLDAAAYTATRKFAETRFGKIAYLERGTGPAALFLHGAPLNSYQWRGAIERLADQRRCIAPDFMGLGYTEVAATQVLTGAAQAEMIGALLDQLNIRSVDIVASDSGGMVAQLFVIRNPDRVRTMLLTNCDTEPDSPPPKTLPIIHLAQEGKLADSLAKWRADHAAARAEFGTAVFQYPERFSDDAIEYYFAPVLRSAHHRERFHSYNAAFLPNPLLGTEAALRNCQAPTRVLWGTGDDLFSQASPEYLDKLLPKSRGSRRIEGAKLFWPEEQPDIIAEEARQLWNAPGTRAATG